MRRHLAIFICSWAGLVLSIAGTAAPAAPVKAWTEPLVIPTYEAGEPDLLPIFFTGRTYQGAKGPVYPYALWDKLTDEKKPKSYQAVYLENEYVKICILPELGGRIFYATDKTNNYHYFYKQSVIKPALIGMIGAWISGGVEWNVPHHHRASTFLPADWRIAENPDGSRTVWLGETELRHRMKWLMGLTLRAGTSRLEATFKMFNRTPVANSFLYFANVAVHTNENYQVIFPPDVEYVTQHAKREFSEWPISRSVYGGIDFTKGVDVSWWKNHPAPGSMFAWNSESEFLAGYDHGKQAGTLHVANPHLVPGKKFFSWGLGPSGAMWDQILSDEDGPYLELMVGAFSDNQPDYSWVQPYEVKEVKQYWYPFRNIGGVRNANTEAALNLDFPGQGKARLGVYVTSRREAAKVELRAAGRTIFEQVVALSPAQAFQKEVDLPTGAKPEEITVLVWDGSRELIRYTPAKPKGTPMPEPVRPPAPPSQMRSQEELYLAGLRLEQFYSPALEPYPYYEEALRRDPGDYRVNVALGILYLKRGMFGEAERCFRTAAARASANYTRPKDGEASFYLGQSLLAQGRLEEARAPLFQAAWSDAWQAAAYLALAQISSRSGDFEQAVAHVDSSLATNTRNIAALQLKVAVLRRLERYREAESLARHLLEVDPLNFGAQNELALARSAMGQAEAARDTLAALGRNMGDHVQSYLEMAVEYGNAGLLDEAMQVLERGVKAAPDAARVSPMVYYFLGFYAEKQGKAGDAANYFDLAARMPPDYCFPFRLEAIEVLRQALAHSPKDARAAYYLGNLLYDHQPEAAIQAWEKSRSLDPGYWIVHRNLALGYSRIERDLETAIASLEKAAELNPGDALVLFELDQLYELANVPAAKRLGWMEARLNTVSKRDDAMSRYVALLLQAGRHDDALRILETRHFHLWEGGARFSVHDSFVAAHLARGQAHLRAGRFREAIAEYEAALTYPQNLEMGKPYRGGKGAEVHYHLGQAWRAAGRQDEARKHFQTSVADAEWNSRGREESLLAWADMFYYQGLSLRELGQSEAAARIFQNLIAAGEKAQRADESDEFFAKFGEKESERARIAQAHYLVGLGCLGQGDKARAKNEFAKALELNQSHVAAQAHVRELAM